MKIGVALTGSSVDSVCSFTALQNLREQGFLIDHVSCCGLSAVTALPFCFGADETCCEAIAAKLLNAKTGSYHGNFLSEILLMFPQNLKCIIPISICAVDLNTRDIVVYSSCLTQSQPGVRVYPLQNAGQSLQATLGGCANTPEYRHNHMRLCDYSLLYGCPYIPLKLSKTQRIMAVSVRGGSIFSPSQLASSQLADLSRSNADVSVQIELPEGAEFTAKEVCAEINREMMQNSNKIYEKLLFS